jgi:hypothetical protein
VLACASVPGTRYEEFLFSTKIIKFVLSSKKNMTQEENNGKKPLLLL